MKKGMFDVWIVPLLVTITNAATYIWSRLYLLAYRSSYKMNYDEVLDRNTQFKDNISAQNVNCLTLTMLPNKCG